MKFRLFIIILLQCFVITPISSQNDITFQAHLDIDDGLKNRANFKIDRDKDGFFWLLQTNAVQRFDGSTFSDHIAHSVPHPRYFKCLSTGKILLISHELEVFLIDPKEKKVELFPLLANHCNDCTLFDINNIGEKILLYFKSGNTFQVYQLDFSDDDPVPHFMDSIHIDEDLSLLNIFKGPNAYLLISTDENAYIKRKDSTVIQKVSTSFRDVTRYVESQYLDENILYFSFPTRKGTYMLKGDEFHMIDEFKRLSFAKKDKKGNILLGLSNSFRHTESIYVINGNRKVLRQDLTNINETFQDIYAEDQSDKIILASYTGLYYIKSRTAGIRPFHLSPIKRNGFGNVIMTFAQDSDGNINYIKEGGGVFRYSENGIEEFLCTEIIENNLHCTYNNQSERLLVAGYSNNQKGVLFEIDKNGFAKTYFFPEPVLYFESLNKSVIRICTGTSRGTIIADYDLLSSTVMDNILSLKNERIRKFEDFDDRRMIIGTSKRLILFDLETSEIEDIIKDTYIQTIVKTKAGWALGTIGHGLFFLDNDLEIVKIFNTHNGLSNDQVYSITETQDGIYWIGTGFGLNAIDGDFNIIRRFLREDGLSDPEFNTNSSHIMPNGNILFGTINGLTEVNPVLALNSSESQIFDVPSISYELAGQVISHPLIAKAININSSARNIELSIRSNDFFNITNSSNYMPRIVSIEPENTNYTVNGDIIKIEKLQKGSNIIKISHPNSVFAEKLLEIEIESKRDNLLLYRVLIIGGLLVLISYFISRRIIKQIAKNEKLERENAVKMAELELQALRSQMNPHFIFNSLGAILLYMQTNEKKKAEKYLTKFAKLMRMFLESSKSKFIPFQEECDLLILYLELEKLRFEDKFDYSINIDSRIDTRNLTLPSMLLQPFVENSINHGLYHLKNKCGLLSIKAVPNADSVIVIIEDNGIGREKSREIKKKSLKKHKSRATEIIQERLEVLKKEKNIDIEIKYEDLVEDNGEGSGTRVTIRIPKLLKDYD